jgi:hypothetical protein
VIDVGSAIGWGALATALLTLLLTASQGLGWSRISLPYLLGTMFAAERNRAMAIGFGLHWLVGLAFALLYALVFEGLGRGGALLGAGLGLFHGLFVLVVGMEILAALHPRMASRHHGPTPARQLEPPGFLALHYGRSAPLVTLLAHVAYGAVLGGLYHLSA